MDQKPIALEQRALIGARLQSPSVGRNKDAISDAFGHLVGEVGQVLEIGSGTGEHGAYLSTAYPQLKWLPSDPDRDSRASIAAWATHVPDGRMAEPLDIRVDTDQWWTNVEAHPDVIVSINMIHIAPPKAMTGLLTGSAQLLKDGGKLFLYGPFFRDGQAADSNIRFDADLKRRDPRWGVRDLDREVVPFAASQGLALDQVREMPANNLSVVFIRKN